MKRNNTSKLLCILCILLLIFSVCGCASTTKAQAISLENDWHYLSDSDIDESKAQKGFTDGEPIAIGLLPDNGYQSVKFDNTLAKGSTVLRLYDAQGVDKLWLNGKEISVADFSDVSKEIKSGSNTLVAHLSGENGSLGSKVTVESHNSAFVKSASTSYDPETQVCTLELTLVNLKKAAEQELDVVVASEDNDVVEYHSNQVITVVEGESKITLSLPYETSSDGYTSVIWFATEFEADFDMLENQRVVLELEGVQYYTKLWMNGNLAGEHYGSYGKFYIDVTDYIRPGETNLIAMRLCSPKNS